MNNDGLPDIYFTSNLTRTSFHLNEGGLRFKMYHHELPCRRKMSTDGTQVSMADVNNDGWLDVYVCRAGWYKDPGNGATGST